MSPAKTYLGWDSIRDCAALGTCVRRVMVEARTSWCRRGHHATEFATDTMPDAASRREADDVVLAGIVETSGSHYDADGDADETVGLPSGPKDEVTCSRASAMGSSADSSCGPGVPFTVMTPCRQLESSESVLVR